LAKIASLSLSTQDTASKDNSVRRIEQRLPAASPKSNGYFNGVLRALSPTSRPPLSIRDLDALLALCSTAGQATEEADATRLISQVAGYLPESHTQTFERSPYLPDLRPTPWTVLTSELTSALLRLGEQHPSLNVTVFETIQAYISNWSSSASTLASQSQVASDADLESEALDIVTLAVSFSGFLAVVSEHDGSWDPSQRAALVRSVKEAITDDFLIAVEKAASAIRHSTSDDITTRDWKKYLKRYAASGNPVGAMLLQKGFIHLLLSCTSRLGHKQDKDSQALIRQYLREPHADYSQHAEVSDEMIEYLVELITEQMRVLEDGSDYLQLSSSWQQRLAFSVKASAIESYLHCMVIDEDIADAEILLGWLEDTLSNSIQMADVALADITLKGLAIVSQYMSESAPNIVRSLLKFVVQSTSMPEAVASASESLSVVLRTLSQDAIITTLYSLGNILSSQSTADKHPNTLSPSPDAAAQNGSLGSRNKRHAASVISLSMSGDEETSAICGNVSHAIVEIATSCKDSKITALAQTMMLQKIGRISVGVDARIVEESAKLAPHGRENEFRSLLRLHSRMHSEAMQQNNTVIFEAVRKARQYLATNIDTNSSLFRIYAYQLLERIVSKGDVHESEFKHSAEVEQAAQEIGPLLKPLAILAVRRASAQTTGTLGEDAEMAAMVRDAWFNIAVHGITLQSRLGQQYYQELRLLAKHSLPLIDQERLELLESDVELSSILRRGMSDHHTSDQRNALAAVLGEGKGDFRSLSYQKVVFLNAVYLVESLRATSGQCSEILQYFADPTLQSSNMGKCLTSVAASVVARYTQKITPGTDHIFSAPFVSRQLVRFFSGCCHRSQKLQQVARAAAHQIIDCAPSALIQKAALFGLLELLTLMWSSCLDEDIDEYTWKSTLTSKRGKITVDLSDDYAFRKTTLNLLYNDARRWVELAQSISPLDVKGLLQTYLSEFDDTGAYGHVSLGRSFALEMGSAIPPMDQRLAAIDRKGEFVDVNVASDFVAQYTTRQEYRFAGIPDHAPSRVKQSIAGMRDGAPSASRSVVDVARDAEDFLTQVRDGHITNPPISSFKEILRRAAAVLCTSKRSQTAIVHHLVSIPFEILNKDSIKLGISLWLGVIHENPRMESRILTEVAQAWERTTDRKVGIFSATFQHPDPFYQKEEFAPSDKATLQYMVQLAQTTISPHLRLIHFFQSHFNAIRLGSDNTQRTFIRIMVKTLKALLTIKGHPLLRELHFQVISFALHLLRFSTCFTKLSLWTFKDLVISVALSWFRSPPAWSFGGNRLQMKAELQILQIVLSLLQQTRHIGNSTSANRRDARPRIALLEALLSNEMSRLSVWLFPRKHESHQSHQHSASLDTSAARTAWNEDPALAIQLLNRYPSENLHRDVRFLLLNFPDKAVGDPYALELMLEDKLSSDVKFQLKYLLYWAPVNPIRAVTYFMPAFGNHPLILQYAMRALESHSVDITFFYVPQIVQCLRYDALGYVARYINETGKFSQLFAHQIIWNIKANAYKDDDATIPDAIKPTLDEVMDKLISSFTGEDKQFYEREFAFFNEVTDVSGKLKPFIKKSKPEKKQKIEEELRKIKVDVGVYLPCNPEGVVVGIDRKSGKPLQSHAKAPYMATFRIRKQRHLLPGDTIVDERPRSPKESRPNHERSSSAMSTVSNRDPNTYEVWQSAIFKVGDDCRQDILALQMIAAFRGIFNSVGLDVYVYPYQVIATAPGCGVIEVLPNSISRDMLGREAVNGLHDYFITKYGGEHSIRYQEARGEFVKSMAAYSVISYLMQFKDRHNGNIMLDDKGHILHIDFGFCFDISPGGVRFERAPFKLTSEMMAVLGGDDSAQSYRWFEELTIKAFLCSRQYCSKLCDIVGLMLDSGLPCFKPETMRNFRERFVLEKSEREAAAFMLGCIRKSEANVSTKVYDEFQLLTNGIPY
jgi:phosphatidylinositol 4-kinase A